MYIILWSTIYWCVVLLLLFVECGGWVRVVVIWVWFGMVVGLRKFGVWFHPIPKRV